MSFEAKKLRKGEEDFLSLIKHVGPGSRSTRESILEGGGATAFTIPDWIESRFIHKGCLKDKPPE